MKKKDYRLKIYEDIDKSLNEEGVSIDIIKTISKFLRQLNIFASPDKEKKIAQIAAKHPDTKKINMHIRDLEDKLLASYEKRYKTDPIFKKIVDALK